MTTIRLHKIIAESYVDGPGKRTVLFTQGCPIHCPGCQNQHIWPFDGGLETDVRNVAKVMAEMAGPGGNVTISGGEPFAQVTALSALLRELKDVYHIGHVIVYSGFTWEELVSPLDPVDIGTECSILAALTRIDVLVDGQFIKALDDPYIAYRGSRNQRAIDVQASLKTWGDWSIPPVELDWSGSEISIAPDGVTFFPIGLVKEFSDLGTAKKTRMCGQTKGGDK